MISKYQQAFDAITPVGSFEEIKREVAKILEQEEAQNTSTEVKKFLHGTIDLTTLAGADTETKVAKLVGQVNDWEGMDATVPNVAAICTYPNFVPLVRESLTAEGVKVACVSGAFPASQSFIEVKTAEVALAAMAGADEIDIVLDLGKFFEEEYEEVTSEIEELRAAARDSHLKVILETGAMQTSEQIRRACVLALYSGADFLKTSTGKEYPGASLEAAYILAQVIKSYYQLHGERRGIKISGGVRTSQDAIRYYTIVRHILGDEWMTPELFRIGASSLVNSLQAEIL